MVSCHCLLSYHLSEPIRCTKNCEYLNYRMLELLHITQQYKYVYVVTCKFVSVGDIVLRYQIYYMWLRTALNCTLTTGVYQIISSLH